MGRRIGVVLVVLVAVATALVGSPAQAVPERAPAVDHAGSSDPESAGQTITPASVVDLADALVGSGVTVTAATYTGDPLAAAEFTGFTDLGFDGVILSTGFASGALGPNDSGGTSGSTSGGADSWLYVVFDGVATQDAAVLELQFVPKRDEILLDYVFASEDYVEWVPSEFADVFQVQVNDITNCAAVDGEHVSTNSINHLTRTSLYRDNQAGAVDIEYDGLTTRLTCRVPVIANTTNTLRLAIADVDDDEFDSALMLPQHSLVSTGGPDAHVRSTASGLWLGEDRYLTQPAASQTVAKTVTANGSTTAFVRVQNDSSVTRSFRLRGVESGSSRLAVTYLRNGQNVTTAVRAANGYLIRDLAPGASTVVSVRGQASALPRGASRLSTLTVRTTTTPALTDVARVRISRP